MLLDDTGDVLWSCHKSFPVREFHAAYGDVDGDGDLEFCVQRRTYPQVALIDHHGEVLWQAGTLEDGRFRCVILGPEMPDIDGDGKADIVGFDGRRFHVFDGEGNLLRTLSLSEGHSIDTRDVRITGSIDYELAASIDKLGVFINHRKDGWLYLPIRVGAEPVAFGVYSDFGVGSGIRVKFKLDAPPYFVMSSLITYQGREFAGFEKTAGILSVYNSERKLVYQEVLPFVPDVFEVVPTNNGDAESLWFGGRGNLYRYTAE